MSKVGLSLEWLKAHNSRMAEGSRFPLQEGRLGQFRRQKLASRAHASVRPLQVECSKTHLPASFMETSPLDATFSSPLLPYCTGGLLLRRYQARCRRHG